MEDIFGIGKVLPIDKLIDILTSVTGRVSKSYFDKKDINTKAYEIKKLAEARAEEIKLISQAVKENYSETELLEYKDNTINVKSDTTAKHHTLLPEISLQERTNERLNLKEAKKQLNVEGVTYYAAEALKEEDSVTDEPIDEDWKTRFFNIVEDISNDEMQALWGRILAGEIKQPRSYSLRTLELLKNLSKDEAEVFIKFAQLRVNSGNKHFVYNHDNGEFLESEFGITFMDRLLMTELGLLTSENNLDYQLYASTELQTHVIYYGKKCIVLERANTPAQHLHVLVFTKIGIELSNLITENPSVKYIEKLCEAFKHENVVAYYGDVIKHSDGTIRLHNRVDYKNE